MKEQERIRQFALHHLPEVENSDLVSQEVIQAICDKHLVCQSLGGDSVPQVESLSMFSETVPESFEYFDGFPIVHSVSEEELKEKQRADPAIREVIHNLESGDTSPPTVRKELSDFPFLVCEWKKLELKNGILYRKRTIGEEIQYQLVLPDELQNVVLKSLHNDMGHLGLE